MEGVEGAVDESDGAVGTGAFGTCPCLRMDMELYDGGDDGDGGDGGGGGGFSRYYY